MKQNNLSLFQLLTIAYVWFFSMNLSIIHAQTYGQRGMVVSSNVIASQIGIGILKKGGNAIDASIATAFALQVTHPTAGNIGGGGFLVFMNAVGMVTT
ncbi:MAG: gamma-glutamyltransferase, partial [Saprospiraceae bacterium]